MSKTNDELKARLASGESIDSILRDVTKSLKTAEKELKDEYAQKQIVSNAANAVVDAYINFLKAKGCDITSIADEKSKKRLAKILEDLDISLDIKNGTVSIKEMDFPFDAATILKSYESLLKNPFFNKFW